MKSQFFNNLLGIGACFFCWIPFLGLLSIPLAAIGLLLAAVGITASVVGKKSSPSLPISGAIVCFVAILIALFVTGGISTLIEKGKRTNQVQVSKSADKTSLMIEEWSKSDVVRQGDVEITMDQMRIGQATQGGVRISSQQYLFVHIVVENLSATKKTDCMTWRSSAFGLENSPAVLTDNFGNIYEQQRPTGAFMGCDDKKTLYPKSQFSDVLYFQAPVQNIQWIHLELPAKNFGGKGMIRFEVATNDIQILKYLPPFNPHPAF